MCLSVQGGLEPCSGCVFSTKYFFFFFLQKLVDELKNRAHGFQCPSCISHSIFTLGANAVFSPFYNNSIFTTLFISTVIMTIAYSNYSIPTIHSSTNCSCQLSLYKHYQYAFANPTAHNLLPCEIFIYNYSCQIKFYILHETTVS